MAVDNPALRQQQISVQQTDMTGGENETVSVGMVAPFTTNNLKQRRMANIICDLPELTMRYPCVSKEELKEFATPTTPQPPGGYIPHVSVWRLNPQDKET